MNWLINLNPVILLIVISITYPTFAGLNPDNPYCTHEAPCWKPVDDATFGEECCIPYDHVVNDCVRKYLKEWHGDQCFSQWLVVWEETGPQFKAPDGTTTWSFNFPLWWRKPVVVWERAWTKKWICIKEYAVCEGGMLLTKTDNGFISKVEAYRYGMENKQGEWTPFTKLRFNTPWGPIGNDYPPRPSIPNPRPCNFIDDKCECPW